MAKPNLAKEIRIGAGLRKPNRADIAKSMLLLLISRASILGSFPFSAAFFAACFDKNAAYLGVAVLSAGLISGGAGIMAVKYVIASLIYWLFEKLASEKLQKDVAKASAIGISVCIGGILVLVSEYRGFYDILMLLTEGIIASVMFIIFSKAYTLIKTRKNRTQAAKDEIVSVAVTVGTVITGLSGIVFPFDISLCDIAAVYAVLSLSYHSTLSAAGSGGLCIGFMTAMGTDNAMLMMGVMGLSALFSNLLKSFGRIGAAVGMLGAAAVAILYSGNSDTLPLNIYEVIIGVIGFIATPLYVHNFISVFFSNTLTIENVSLDLRVKDYLSSHISRMSEVFSTLYESFVDSSEKRLMLYSKEAGAMLDDVTGRVCADCPMSNKCWQSEFSNTYKQVMRLLSTMETEGVLLNAPKSFEVRCQRTEKFISEFNHVYEIYRQDVMRRGESMSSRDLVSGQYKEISDIMQRISKEIDEGFVFREEMEEAAVEELDKYGINVFEISIIESTQGRMEIYAGLSVGVDIKRCEAVFSEITGSPVGYDSTEKNGIMRFISKAKYNVEYAVRQRCKDLSKICGDSVTVFKTEDYRMYFLISDGMGSGKKASEESKITLKLLSDFLKAGFGIKSSIEMINSTLCLKLSDECFATIDLLCVDLMTGYIEFYKIGSAQSFIYSDGKVDTVFSSSIPAGMLNSVKISGQRRRIYDGDVVLMLSDGITEAGFTAVRSEWIKKEITSLCDSMEDMADNVLHKAIRKGRDTVLDDMSVIAIRLLEE